MKKFHLLFVGCLFSLLSQAQEKNFIRIIVPEADTITTGVRFQRLNGSTQQGSDLKINGVPYKVYPTGAFAGFPGLKEGENRWVIESVHPTGGKVVKTMIINCKIPAPEKAVSGFSIEYARTNPPAFQSLQTDDILQVRMKAQSGCKATFFDDQPMYELPASQTNGIAGIYQGSYKVQADDKLVEAPVPFTLTNETGEILRTVSNTHVSMNSGEFPAVGMTRGILPYFSYGLGEDRLGGARVSYLDTMALLNLTGKTGDMYHVKLSESQSVFIPASSVTLLPKGTFSPSSLTGSWTVTGDGRHDFLRIGLSQRLPYISKYEINPLRIILDIYGATSNTNWITQLNNAREIKNVWYDQPEKNVLRVTIELKHELAWGYLVYYERNQLVVRIKQQPPTLALNSLTIGLDAGHGGYANGALGSTGSKEKDINMLVVLKLKTALERLGARTILTRDSDYDVSTSKRWLIWREADPDIVLSLHCNSIGNSDPLRVKGISTYYKHIAFRPLSKIMYDELLKTGLAEFGNIGSFNFLLNGPTEFPNALIEMAFMSNPEDEMYLLDLAFQDKIVIGIVEGLQKFLKEAKP